MKEQANRPMKKRTGKRSKERPEANPVRPEHAVKIQLQMPNVRIYDAADWSEIEDDISQNKW